MTKKILMALGFICLLSVKVWSADDNSISQNTEHFEHPSYPVVHAYVKGLRGFIDIATLDILKSEPTETKIQFLKRVGKYLTEYTRQTGFEACGMILNANGGNQWAVRVTTSKGHIGCVETNLPVEGFQLTPDSIHSHPLVLDYKATETDELYSGHLVKRGKRSTIPGFYFSSRDYDTGPGYLVTQGHLYYQHGFRTDVDLGSLDDTNGMTNKKASEISEAH